MTKRSAPRVSVCIPTYNYGHLIATAIESVIAQSYADWELIICDNCSTDDTAEVVRGYQGALGARLRYYRNEQNIGLQGNFNRCKELASGAYVLFLCADDGLDAHALEQQVAALEHYPGAALACAYQIEVIDEAGCKTGIHGTRPLRPGYYTGAEILRAQCRHSAVVGNPSQVLIRRSSLAPGPLCDARFPHCWDYALWSSLCEAWDVVIVKGVRVFDRAHQARAAIQYRSRALDIAHEHDLYQMLFQQSPTLRDRRIHRWRFVRCRLYPWFERAALAALQGNGRHCAWILGRIASFCWFPWWFPYFLMRFVWKRFRRSLGRLRRALRDFGEAPLPELKGAE